MMEKLLFGISKYIRSEAGNLNVLGKLVSILLIFIAAYISTKVISALITRKLYSKSMKKYSSYNRIVTILELVKKVIKALIYFVAVTTSMELLGIKTTSILATVGVGSLALSFGAQNLVKDVINGFFIILEDQYAVGDLIEISEFEGLVEDMGLRCTRLRDFEGVLHIIPNGTITIVSNKQRGFIRAKIDTQIDIKEDPERVIEVIEKSIKSYEKDMRVKKGPIVLGVTDYTEKGYVVSVIAFADIGDKALIDFELRKNIITALNKENINLPQIRINTEKEVV